MFVYFVDCNITHNVLLYTCKQKQNHKLEELTMKESEVRAICKKCGFSANKKYTRFKNNWGGHWLHIEDTKRYGFIEYDYDRFVVFASGYRVSGNDVKGLADFFANASKLINQLKENGVTEYNIELDC